MSVAWLIVGENQTRRGSGIAVSLSVNSLGGPLLQHSPFCFAPTTAFVITIETAHSTRTMVEETTGSLVYDLLWVKGFDYWCRGSVTLRERSGAPRASLRR
jgi:hypothetical protein